MKKNILPEERIGEKYIQNCGMYATCVEYRNSHDIDVKFEDKTIIHHKTWKNFKNGNIANPNVTYDEYRTRNGRIPKNDYMNTQFAINDDISAIIVEYTDYHHVKILDSIGISRIVSMDYLKRNKHKVVKKSEKMTKKRNNINYKAIRIKEKRMMRCGMYATIIDYCNSHDITVQFDDGTIVFHKEYRSFINGNIKNANIKKEKKYKRKKEITNKKILAERNGQRAKMRCGMNATIIDYNKSNDMTVRFDDGYIATHIRYSDFLKGHVANHNLTKNKQNIRYNNSFASINNDSKSYPRHIKKERIGESAIMNCGMVATIIEYRNSESCDIQFEDGYILNNVRYQTFKKGRCHNKQAFGATGISRNEFALLKILEPFGFKKAEQGSLIHEGLGRLELDCFCDNFYGNKIAIEYDGGMVSDTRGHTAKRDKIKNAKCKKAHIDLIRIREPQLPALADSSYDFYLETSEVLSDNFKDVVNDVISFLNKNYMSNIPPIYKLDKEQLLKQFKNECCGTLSKENLYLGDVKTMNNGMDAIVIKYRNYKDIDIEFEDGTVRKHVAYQTFKRGEIANPNLKIS